MIQLCCVYLSVRYIWLYVVIMSRTSFRVNLDSIVCLNVKDFLSPSRHHMWGLSDSNEMRTQNHLVCKGTQTHLAKLTKWLSCVVSTYLYLFQSLPECQGIPCSRRPFQVKNSLTFRQTIECEFILKLVRDMIITYS